MNSQEVANFGRAGFNLVVNAVRSDEKYGRAVSNIGLEEDLETPLGMGSLTKEDLKRIDPLYDGKSYRLI